MNTRAIDFQFKENKNGLRLMGLSDAHYNRLKDKAAPPRGGETDSKNSTRVLELKSAGSAQLSDDREEDGIEPPLTAYTGFTCESLLEKEVDVIKWIPSAGVEVETEKSHIPQSNGTPPNVVKQSSSSIIKSDQKANDLNKFSPSSIKIDVKECKDDGEKPSSKEIPGHDNENHVSHEGKVSDDVNDNENGNQEENDYQFGISQLSKIHQRLITEFQRETMDEFEALESDLKEAKERSLRRFRKLNAHINGSALSIKDVFSTQ